MPLVLAITCLLMIYSIPAGASPDLANKIKQTWKLEATKWKTDVAKAVTPQERAALLKTKPSAAAYAARMWGVIGTSLNEPWTIEPAAWFLQLSHGIRDPDKPVPLFDIQIERTKKAILEHHIRKPDHRLYGMCLALTRLSDPMSLSILEKIEHANPDPKIQGVAALCAAIVIKGLGDEGELMRKRLNYIRKAIINSAEVAIGDTTVAKMAENELYQIRFLSKGRVAPDIISMDSNGEAFQLSKQAGKVTVLVFWSSTIPQADHVIEFTNEMVSKFIGKPIQVIGINHDPLARLRAMRLDDTVKWRNLSDPTKQISGNYRIANWPMVYVLNHKREIQYAGGLGSFAELTADALAEEIK